MKMSSLGLACLTTIASLNCFAGKEGGGGILSRSSRDKIMKALEQSHLNVSAAYHRMSSIYFDLEIQYDDDDPNRKTGRIQGLQIMPAEGEPYIYRSNEMANFLDPQNQSRVQQAIASLKFHLQKEPCRANAEDTDAWSETSGDICLNVTSLERIPPVQLELELTALLAHEVTHVLSVDHPVGPQIQAFLLSTPAIAFAKSEPIHAISQAYRAQLGEMSRVIRLLSDALETGDLSTVCFATPPEVTRMRETLIDQNNNNPDLADDEIGDSTVNVLKMALFETTSETYGHFYNEVALARPKECSEYKPGIKMTAPIQRLSEIMTQVRRAIPSLLAKTRVFLVVAQNFENEMNQQPKEIALPYATDIGVALMRVSRRAVEVNAKGARKLVSDMRCHISQNGVIKTIDLATVVKSPDNYFQHAAIEAAPGLQLWLSQHKVYGKSRVDSYVSGFLHTQHPAKKYEFGNSVNASIDGDDGNVSTLLAPQVNEGFRVTAVRGADRVVIACGFKGKAIPARTTWTELFGDN